MTVGLIAFLFCATSGGAAAESDKKKISDVAGIVISKVGDWEIAKDKEIRTLDEGDSIPDGWTLKPKKSNNTITVLLNNGKVMKCPDATGQCQQPLKGIKPTTWYDNIYRTAMRLVAGSRSFHG